MVADLTSAIKSPDVALQKAGLCHALWDDWQKWPFHAGAGKVVAELGWLKGGRKLGRTGAGRGQFEGWRG